jgi:hypothetical protein
MVQPEATEIDEKNWLMLELVPEALTTYRPRPTNSLPVAAKYFSPFKSC